MFSAFGNLNTVIQIIVYKCIQYASGRQQNLDVCRRWVRNLPI